MLLMRRWTLLSDFFLGAGQRCFVVCVFWSSGQRLALMRHSYRYSAGVPFFNQADLDGFLQQLH
jgi:hypothetical protein